MFLLAAKLLKAVNEQPDKIKPVKRIVNSFSSQFNGFSYKLETCRYQNNKEKIKNSDFVFLNILEITTKIAVEKRFRNVSF